MPLSLLRRTLFAAWLGFVFAAPATAQETRRDESQFRSDLRREGEHIAASCNSVSPKALGGCAYTLITSYPFHVALGNLAPGNGFGYGAALSERYTPNESWRLTFSGDVVGSLSGAHRIGGYTKFIHTPGLGVVVRRPGDPPVKPRRLKLDTWVIDVFAQRTSLETIDYYGLGADSLESGRSVFGEGQTIVGGTGLWPLSGKSWIGALHPAPYLGVSTRVIDIRSGASDDVESIDTKYTDLTAPGLSRQDPFVEFAEGVRLRPSAAKGRLNFNYLLSAQQFVTSRESRSSFTRWTLDLQHEIPIYRGASSSGPPPDFNGPNECSATTDSLACPTLQQSRNRTGSIGLRLLTSTSGTSPGNEVPFYLQQTLGGSDLNGGRLLASFADYRFRGPNMIALQESFEHSLTDRFPIGVFAMAEQGKVTLRRGDLNFSGLERSYSVGLTLRAGGFPMLSLTYARGPEGNHVIATMNASLLGGSSRPSLY